MSDAVSRGAELVASGKYKPSPESAPEQAAAKSVIHYEMPRLWAASDLEAATQPRWLAKGRLPRAAISLLVGAEGIGKSLLWGWIVAAITTGKALPEFGIPPRDPDHVILICTEDDWSTTVRPRLEVAGADLEKVSVICTEKDGSGAPVFPRDMNIIRDSGIRPAIIVVDAWLDTVHGSMNVRDPQQARQALHPWREIATTTDAAVLLLCHTNRVASPNARDRYGATGELRKKARMTLYAQTDDEGHLLVGPEKSNLSAPIPASMFTITGVQYFAPTEESDGKVPRLTYAGDSDRTAREHIADSVELEAGADKQERTDAVRWLREYLTMNPGVRSSDAKRDAKRDAGISERTLQRARSDLGVVIGYAGMPAVSVWTLPVSSGTTETSGISAGQEDMPSCANSDSGTTVAQQPDQQELPVVPRMPETQGNMAQRVEVPQ